MVETHYHSQPALRDPRRFIASAGHDLRRAGPVAWRLFRSSVRARHQRAGLGYLWLVIPSLATTAIAVYLQSRGVIAVGATGIPYPAYALTGIVLWQVFTDALGSPLRQFDAGRQVLTRSRVPLEALVLGGLMDVALDCAIRLLALAGALVLLGVTPGASVWLAPLGIVALALFGLALGLLMSPVGMLYDDVGRGLTLVTGLWFFLTPVLYPAPAAGALRFNPVTPLLESARAGFTGGPPSEGFILVTMISAVALAGAWFLLRLARPHVIARLG
jgi:lipopolysaccharide transport system permease protein